MKECGARAGQRVLGFSLDPAAPREGSVPETLEEEQPFSPAEEGCSLVVETLLIRNSWPGCVRLEKWESSFWLACAGLDIRQIV